jgi:hypothetical protein
LELVVRPHQHHVRREWGSLAEGARDDFRPDPARIAQGDGEAGAGNGHGR